MPLFRQSRRHFHHLIRAVLCLYILTLGVAMASPMFKSEAMNLICTSTGYKLVSQTGEIGNKPGNDNGDSSKSITHLLDCSLCLATGIPPALPQQDACEPPHVLSYALRSIPAACLAAIVAAPLPARGPPSV
ncbi:DUF2946 domain-containing protein [Undibacterium sp. SXout7W]|uniref:DUF2946 domain-containing protein n=1 Tax=Undibacterium sp. SXout7W TaxID=3413049 RepID=UPI003BF10538